MSPTVALLFGVLTAVLILITAIVGLGTAVISKQHAAREHLDRQDEKLEKIEILVDGNLAQVKSDLAVAIERIMHLDAAIAAVTLAAHSVPNQTTTQALKETADIAEGVTLLPFPPDPGTPPA